MIQKSDCNVCRVCPKDTRCKLCGAVVPQSEATACFDMTPLFGAARDCVHMREANARAACSEPTSKGNFNGAGDRHCPGENYDDWSASASHNGEAAALERKEVAERERKEARRLATREGKTAANEEGSAK
jgi:hypothetical protein